MKYSDYKPSETRAHTKEDLPLIQAMVEYLKTNPPEQLLRSVASAAIDAQVGGDDPTQHERDCALGWLNWKANEVANGK
jgi:hypothetical protein